MSKISVVVPVYNVASYLRRSLDSLLHQSVADWEAICVDDGSTDESGSILDEYASKDSRFVIIHQKNCGVSAARQAGLVAASGIWLASMDPDDWVGPDFIAHMVSVAEESDADLVWADFYEEIDGALTRSRQRTDCVVREFAKGLLKGTVWGGMWNKLFRLDFVRSNGIRFPETRLFSQEDSCFVASVLSRRPRIAYSSSCDYHYCIRAGSAIHSRTTGLFETWTYYQSCVERSFSGWGLDDVLQWRRKHAKYLWYTLSSISDEEFYKTFPEVTAVWDLDVKPYHKVLFWLAAHGMRRYVVAFFAFKRRSRQ